MVSIISEFSAKGIPFNFVKIIIAAGSFLPVTRQMSAEKPERAAMGRRQHPKKAPIFGLSPDAGGGLAAPPVSPGGFREG
jgi:hypothetical protein